MGAGFGFAAGQRRRGAAKFPQETTFTEGPGGIRINQQQGNTQPSWTNVLQNYPGISPVNAPLSEIGANPRGPMGKWFADFGRGLMDPSRLQQLSASGLETRGMRPMGYRGFGGQGVGIGDLGAGDILKKILLERGYQG